MRIALCFMLALAGCAHQDSTTTTTSARIAEPVWSPSPGPESSQMPFDLPKQLIRERTEVDRVRDAEIAARVHTAIVSDPNLTEIAKEVDVTTVDGIVTIQGRVETAQDKAELDRIARATNGVRRVDNRVRVVP